MDRAGGLLSKPRADSNISVPLQCGTGALAGHYQKARAAPKRGQYE